MPSKYKPIVCALKNYNLNSREKFEPGPGIISEIKLQILFVKLKSTIYYIIFVKVTTYLPLKVKAMLTFPEYQDRLQCSGRQQLQEPVAEYLLLGT